MTNIYVTVKDGETKAVLTGVLTAGMVGVPVEFQFGPEWQDLSITAVFKGSATTIDRVLLGTNKTTVPHEVLALVGSSLWLGAEGRNAAGDLVIPSTMVKAGDILCGAEPSGDASLDPTQPVWAELMTAVNELSSTAEGNVKSVNGIAPDENGNVKIPIFNDVDREQMDSAVREVLAEAKASGEFDGEDYVLTDADKDEIAAIVKEQVPLVKSAEEPAIVSSVDEMTDTSKHYVLSSDGCFYAYRESENYNLLKLSEVIYAYRLQNDSEELVSSTTANLVTGWFPVTYGKYYVASVYRSDLGYRVGYSPAVIRAQLLLADGTIKVYTNASGGSEYPYDTLKYNNLDVNVRGVDDENAVGMRMQLAITDTDISTAALFGAYQPMIVEGDTQAEAAANAIDLAYIEGDTETVADWVNTGLAYNQPADYEDRIVELESDVANLEASIENPASASPYYRDVDYGVIPTAYYQGVGTSYDAEGFDRDNTFYASFISAWKALVANHSTYVTETALGTASDGQTIYLYDFKPARITNQNKPIPKVIIVAGQHGWEKANVYGLYYFVGNLLNRWTQHPALEYLRNHVELMIVPVVNTYGFDNLTYVNGNGVNINRNYESNWVLLEDTTSNQYGGAEPFDQPESQIIRDLILANPYASLVIDCHSCHHYNPETIEELTYLGVCSSTDSYYNRMLDVASHHFARMSAHFNVDYEMNQPDVIMGFLTKSAGNGILRSWVTDNNIVGVLVEGLQGFYEGESFVGDVYKADEEHIVNYLITALNYLAK